MEARNDSCKKFRLVAGNAISRIVRKAVGYVNIQDT